MCGQSCDMKSIYTLSKEYGFKIIEDASHAIGGKFMGEPIGNCKYSDITIFSFHPVKIITTGEGGMATTNNLNLAAKIELLRSHGITRNAAEMTQTPDGPWFYQQLDLGFNYRMTDIQAALGLSQIKRLDKFVQERHIIAKRYNKLLTQNWITIPWQSSDNYSSFHLYVIRIKKINKITNQLHLFEKLRSSGILVNLHYIPIYKHPYYKKMGFEDTNFPESESYYSEAISLPIYSGLSESQQDQVVDCFKNCLGYQNLF